MYINKKVNHLALAKGSNRFGVKNAATRCPKQSHAENISPLFHDMDTGVVYVSCSPRLRCNM